MPIFIVVIFAVLSGVALVFAAAYHGSEGDGDGFLGWLRFAFFVVPLFVGSIVWSSLAYYDRAEDPNYESFHVVDTAEQNGISIQYIIAKYDNEISFVNLSEKFNGMIGKDVFVRRYCLDEWKYGIYFHIFRSDYEYELIGSDHEQYAKVKEKNRENTTTKPVN